MHGGEQNRFIQRTSVTSADAFGILSSLKDQGWYVSAGTTQNNQKFIAASRENIFAEWAHYPGNWLLRRGARAGKIGEELITALEQYGSRTGATVTIKNGFVFYQYGNVGQCATGLKFHVSVHPNDLENAAYIVDDVVRSSGVASQWKVAYNGMTSKQVGKEFTIYVNQDGYNETRLQSFLDNLETALRRNTIQHNGAGINIQTGDKPVHGSKYINYRYDRIDSRGGGATAGVL